MVLSHLTTENYFHCTTLASPGLSLVQLRRSHLKWWPWYHTEVASIRQAKCGSMTKSCREVSHHQLARLAEKRLHTNGVTF